MEFLATGSTQGLPALIGRVPKNGRSSPATNLSGAAVPSTGRPQRLALSAASDGAMDHAADGALTTVLYVGGTQRSGSTLLDRMLGQLPDHLSAGELVHLWNRGLQAGELCGCGKGFRECPFWADVGRVAFGGWDRLNPEHIVSLQRGVDRNRYIIFMLVPVLWPAYRRRLKAYTRLLERLYDAIHQVGGGRVIVDSSKHISTAFMLRHVGSVRLHVVHLVRDSRGVAFSLMKKVPRPEVVTGPVFMHRMSAFRASVEWMAFNALFHLLGTGRTPMTLVRYEDLVASPRDVIRGVAADEGRAVRAADLGFIHDGVVSLDVSHTVAGNPMRMHLGLFDLRPDEEWKSKMGARERATTWLVTFPLLARYGYWRGW